MSQSQARVIHEAQHVVLIIEAYRVAEPTSVTQVVSMVKNHLLQPIIDAAARLGEEVLSSRAAQKAFERRSVHKYAFTVAPLYFPEASPTHHISDGGRNGGNGRGIAVFPELGQVVSVSGKSTLVAHRESLSLQYLRRSFLRIGPRAAWGKVRKGNKRVGFLSVPVTFPVFGRMFWHFNRPPVDVVEVRPSPLHSCAIFPLETMNTAARWNNTDLTLPGSAHRSVGAQISAADFRTELLNNPILAASLALPNGGDSEPRGVEGGPGARALREMLGRRHRRHCSRHRSRNAGEELPDNGEEKYEKQQQHSAMATISWPEFVDAFIPLGQWGWDDAVDAEPQQATLIDGGVANQDQGRREAGEEHTQEEGIVGEDEMQLLRVAFAATAVGASRNGEEAGAGAVVSLAELRAASALLDGVEPPEEPVRQALGVNSGTVLSHSSFFFYIE